MRTVILLACQPSGNLTLLFIYSVISQPQHLAEKSVWPSELTPALGLLYPSLPKKLLISLSGYFLFPDIPKVCAYTTTPGMQTLESA